MDSVAQENNYIDADKLLDEIIRSDISGLDAHQTKKLLKDIVIAQPVVKRVPKYVDAIQIKIEVDDSELDKAIEKIKQIQPIINEGTMNIKM